MSRALLLIDYHFGNAKATGGFRWNAMARDLAAKGWTFDVITHGPASNPAEPVPGIRVHFVPAPTLVDDAIAAVGRAKRRLRGGPRAAGQPGAAVPALPAAVSAPTGRGGWYAYVASWLNAVRITYGEWGWARAARKCGEVLLRERRYRAIVVSTPPHLAQRAGAALSRASGTPYIADFRDPWVFGRAEKYDVNRFANPLGRMFEGPTLRRASRIIGNTEHSRRAIAALYPGFAERSLALPNGYDAGASQPGQPDRERFRVVFAGWLYPFMDPGCVLAAVGRLRPRMKNPDALVVEFMGSGEPGGPGSLIAVARHHGLEDCFRLLPASPREDAARLQAAAAVLVAFDASTELAMPTKFYDYARMGGTMLLLGFPDGALAAAASLLGLRVHAPADAAGLDATLARAYERWHQGLLTAPVDREGIFDRRRQSDRLHDVLMVL